MTKLLAPGVTLHESAVVAQDTNLEGRVLVGAGTIIHPKVTILATKGEIVIGEMCMIEEGCIISNDREEAMNVGASNIFMVGSRLENSSVGDENTFQPGSITSNMNITSHCTIGAGTVVVPDDDDTLPPYSVIYGAHSQKRTWDKIGLESERFLREKHIEYVGEILPKFNRMRNA